MSRNRSRSKNATRKTARPAKGPEILILPDTCGAQLTPGLKYAMRADPEDESDIVITSVQLMQNHVPDDATIIEATGPRHYFVTTFDPKRDAERASTRGFTAPFNRMDNRRSVARPDRRVTHNFNQSIPDVGDSEFEDPVPPETTRVDTNEKSAQDTLTDEEKKQAAEQSELDDVAMG